MFPVLLAALLGANATIAVPANGDLDIKMGGVVKARVKAGGYFQPAAAATAALPSQCADGSMAWDSTALQMKSCSGNVWSGMGAGGYVLPAAAATVLGGVKGTGSALVCSGTNKATGFDSAGTLQCGADLQGGAALPTCTSGQAATSTNGTSWSCVSNVSTASALAADPTACTAGSYVTDISAAGVLTCSQPPGTYSLPSASAGGLGGVELDTDLGGTAAAPQVVATHLSAALPQLQGGTGAGSLTCSAGQCLTSNGTAQACTGTITASTYSGAVALSQIADDATAGKCLLSGGAGDPAWTACPSPAADQWSILGSNYTTTNAKANTGIAFVAKAAKKNVFVCVLEVKDQAAAVGVSLLFTSSQTLTRIIWRAQIYKTAAATLTTEIGTAIATTIPAAACAASCVTTSKVWQVDGMFDGHATVDSNITLQASSTTGGASVMAGSYCYVRTN